MVNQAVFLDRDGVINKELGDYVCCWDDFEFNPGTFENLGRLQKAGFLLIVISNQGGVARGRYSLEGAIEILENMASGLAANGIELTEYYFCPHHNDHVNCLCRKPNTLMFEKAIARFNINTNRSYMIGDSQRDITAAEKMGLAAIKIDSNENLSDIVTQIIDS